MIRFKMIFAPAALIVGCVGMAAVLAYLIFGRSLEAFEIETPEGYRLTVPRPQGWTKPLEVPPEVIIAFGSDNGCVISVSERPRRKYSSFDEFTAEIPTAVLRQGLRVIGPPEVGTIPRRDGLTAASTLFVISNGETTFIQHVVAAMTARSFLEIAASCEKGAGLDKAHFRSLTDKTLSEFKVQDLR